ncbi:MAG: hypothetical protein K6U80_13090, partial [Firmicutes bacterium]|nr:hypothetical protein [Bacillota bacterium]
MKKLLTVMVGMGLALALAAGALGASLEVPVTDVLGSANSLAANPARYIADGRVDTVWRLDSQAGSGWAELRLAEKVMIDGIQIYGAYQGSLTVEYWQNNGWHVFLGARDLDGSMNNSYWNLLDISYSRVVSDRIRLWLAGDGPGPIGGIGEIRVLGRRAADIIRRIEPEKVGSADRFFSGQWREGRNPAEYLFDHNTYTGWEIHKGNPGTRGEANVDLGIDSAIDRIKLYTSPAKGKPRGPARVTVQYQSQGQWRDIPGLANVDLSKPGAGWRSFELKAGAVHTSKVRVLLFGEERLEILKEVEIWGRNSAEPGGEYIDCSGAPQHLSQNVAGNYGFTLTQPVTETLNLHIAATGGAAGSPLSLELNGRPMGELTPSASINGSFLYLRPVAPEDLRAGPNFIRVKGAGLTVHDVRIEIPKGAGPSFAAGHGLADRLALTPAAGDETLDLGGKYHLDELRLNYLGGFFSPEVWVEQEGHWVKLPSPRNEPGAVGGTLVYANPGLAARVRISPSAAPGSFSGPAELELLGSAINDGPPRVRILAPADGEILSLSELAKTYLTGTVDNPAAEVRVNGRKIPLEGTGFEAPLASLGLKPGEAQTIEVVAADPDGRSGGARISLGIGLSLGFTLDLPDELIYTKESQITVSGQVWANNCRIYVNGLEVPVKDKAFATVVSLAEGYNPILVKAVFGAFGFSALKLREVIRASAPPYLKVMSPANGQITREEKITVSGQASSLQPVAVKVNGQPAVVEGGSFHSNPITLAEGANQITVTATDRTGLTSRQELAVYRDRTAPSLAEILPVEGANLNTTVITVRGKVTDTSPVWVMVNGAAANINAPVEAQGGTPVPWSININVTEGWNDLKIEARDAAGNTASLTRRVFTDLKPPAAFTPKVSPEGWTNNNRPVISFTTTDAESGVDHYEIAIGGGAWARPVTSPYQFPQALPDGEQTIRVKAVDKAGNETVGEAKAYIDATPPAAPEGFEAIPGIGRVALKWKDATGEVVGYRIERNPAFSGGSFRELLRSETTPDLREYLDEAVVDGATYTYTIKAIDRAGNYSGATQAATVKAGITIETVTDDGATVKFDNCTVTFAKDAVSGDNQVVIQQETAVLPVNNYAVPVGAAYSLKLLDQATGQERPVKFEQPVTLTVNYARMQIPAGYDEGDLGLYWYNQEGGYWQRLEYGSHDFINKTLTVPLEHFSDYQVMASNYVTPSLDSYYNLGVSPFGSYFQDNIESVSTQSGGMSISATDLKLPGPNGFDLVIRRSYDSVLEEQQEIVASNNGQPEKSPVAAFSTGWSLNLPWIEINPHGQFVRLPEGQTIPVFWKNNSFEHHEGSHFTLKKLSSGYELTLKDGTVYKINTEGQAYAQTDPSGKNTITYKYSGRELTEIIDAIGRKIEFTYQAVNDRRVITQIKVGGRLVKYGYDTLGQLTTVTDPAGRKTVYKYCVTPEIKSGSVVTVNNGSNTAVFNTNSTSYRLGLIGEIDYPSGGVSKYSYNLIDQSHTESWQVSYTYTTKFTDENGNTEWKTTTTYYTQTVHYTGTKVMAIKHTIAPTASENNPLVKEINYSYDYNKTALGSFQSGNFIPAALLMYGSTTTEKGKVVKESFQQLVKYFYDYYLTNTVPSMAYFKGCLPVKQEITGNGVLVETVNYYYDESSLALRLVSREEHLRGGKTIYEIVNRYDSWGNLTYRLDGSRNLEETWSYYDHSRIRNLVLTSAKKNFNSLTQQTVTSTTTYQYDDALGKPVQIQTTASDGTSGQITLLEYYGNGNLKKRTDQNGQQGELITLMEYDSHSFPLRKTVKGVIDADKKPVGDIVTRYQYDYNTGLKLSETDARLNTTRYEYDSLNRVTRVILPEEGGQSPYREYVFHDSPGDSKFNTCEFYNENRQLTWFKFDGLGRLTEIVKDPNGLNITTKYHYDALGRIDSVTDPLGRITTYSYDGFNRVIRVTFPKSNPGDSQSPFARLEYDDLTNTVIITDENGGKTIEQSDWANRLIAAYQHCEFPGEALASFNWAFTYDSLGNKLRQTDPLSNLTIQKFDGLGRLVEVVLPEARLTQADGRQADISPTIKYVYDIMGNKVAEIDAKGHRTEYGYDILGRLVKKTVTAKDIRTGQPVAAITRNYYDAAGNKVKTIDANGREWVYEYSARGYLLSEKDPLGNETRYQYDAMGNKKSVTDPLNRTTCFEYDSLNRLVKTILPDGSFTRVEYDKAGNKVKEWDITGLLTEYTYTPRNWVETVKVGGQLRAAYKYDAKGNRIEVKDALNNVTRNAYDSMGRLRVVTRPSGIQEQFKYDPLGNRVQATDGRQNSTIYVYNALGWLTQVTDPLWNVTSYQYDLNGNQVKQIAANNLITTYTYDELNRLVERKDPLENTTQYAYDPVGNRKWMKDARGAEWAYTYQANNRLERVDVSGGGESYWVKYTYDAAGNRTKVEDPGNLNRYSYDMLSRITEVERNFDNAAYRTGYQYQRGLLTGIKYPEAGGWLDYKYNPLNQLQEVVGFTQPGGIQYEADGAVKSVAYANGVTMGYSYDSDRRLRGLTASSGGTGILGLNYSYDNADNITNINDKVYEYDNNNQLKKAVIPGKFLEDKVTTGSAGVSAGDILGTGSLFFGVSQSAVVSVDTNSTSIGLDFGTAAPGVKKILFIPDAAHQLHRV